MTMPTLYFDLGSPYGYLAFERAQSVLGQPIDFEPVLLGVIFALRGRGSWSATTERAARIAELEQRAGRYGIAPIVWPAGWPADGLMAMRAAAWAKRLGRVEAFARAVYRAQFTTGADISERAVLQACATRVGLYGDALAGAVADADVKRALRVATERAWGAGVRGIPTLRCATELFYGDDRLEDAARHLASARAER
ncbi:MAG: 2-hydroxychromene-2-carboxylate isomerase [Solirubrobacteraceae bacterium]